MQKIELSELEEIAELGPSDLDWLESDILEQFNQYQQSLRPIFESRNAVYKPCAMSANIRVLQQPWQEIVMNRDRYAQAHLNHFETEEERKNFKLRNAPAIMIGTLKDHSHGLTIDNIASREALCYDFELMRKANCDWGEWEDPEPLQPQEIGALIGALEPYRYVLYESISSTVDNPRLHLIIAVNAPIPADVYESVSKAFIKRLFEADNDNMPELKDMLDPSSCQLNRTIALPAYTELGHYFIEHLERGVAVNISETIETGEFAEYQKEAKAKVTLEKEVKEAGLADYATPLAHHELIYAFEQWCERDKISPLLIQGGLYAKTLYQIDTWTLSGALTIEERRRCLMAVSCGVRSFELINMRKAKLKPKWPKEKPESMISFLGVQPRLIKKELALLSNQNKNGRSQHDR